MYICIRRVEATNKNFINSSFDKTSTFDKLVFYFMNKRFELHLIEESILKNKGWEYVKYTNPLGVLCKQLVHPLFFYICKKGGKINSNFEIQISENKFLMSDGTIKGDCKNYYNYSKDKEDWCINCGRPYNEH